MIPVLAVPILTRPDLLERMVASIDYPIGRLVVIDNGDCTNYFPLAKNPNVPVISIVRLPANLGVAGSWNLAIKATPFAPYWLIANFDIEWPSGSLARFAEEADPRKLVLSGGAPPWCAFAIGEALVAEVGLFDESLHPAYFEDDDYKRRVDAAGYPIVLSGIPVEHRNSSTLAAGYGEKNVRTFDSNGAYFAAKLARDDYSEGRFSLRRRRENSWD